MLIVAAFVALSERLSATQVSRSILIVADRKQDGTGTNQ